MVLGYSREAKTRADTRSTQSHTTPNWISLQSPREPWSSKFFLGFRKPFISDRLGRVGYTRYLVTQAEIIGSTNQRTVRRRE